MMNFFTRKLLAAALLLLAAGTLTVTRGQITITHKTPQGATVSRNYSAGEFPREVLRDFFANFQFTWITARRDEAVSTSAGELLGRRVNEAALRFQDGKLAEARWSVYSRTLMGRWREEPFNREVEFWTLTVRSWAGGKGRELAELDVNGHVIVRRLWRAGALEYRLEYGYSEVGLWGELPEFLNVSVRRADAAADGHLSNPAARVRRNQAGDVWLPVPMEWQGSDGMCGPVAVARVLRYYGVAMDKHELASVLETGGAGAGTKTEVPVPALRKLAAQVGLQVTVLQDWRAENFSRSFNAYNQLAAQRGKPPLTVTARDKGDVLEFYRRMDRETFRLSRAGQKEELAAFRAAVAEKIKAGVPVVWGVIAGMFPERPPTGAKQITGHLRLIVGVNERTGEILYTDGWGAGHELKRMSAAQAFTISIGAFCLEPKPTR